MMRLATIVGSARRVGSTFSVRPIDAERLRRVVHRLSDELRVPDLARAQRDAQRDAEEQQERAAERGRPAAAAGRRSRRANREGIEQSIAP